MPVKKKSAFMEAEQRRLYPTNPSSLPIAITPPQYNNNMNIYIFQLINLKKHTSLAPYQPLLTIEELTISLASCNLSAKSSPNSLTQPETIIKTSAAHLPRFFRTINLTPRANVIIIGEQPSHSSGRACPCHVKGDENGDHAGNTGISDSETGGL